MFFLPLSLHACTFECIFPSLSLPSLMIIQNISGSSQPDSSWLEQPGQRSSKDWPSAHFPITRGLHKSTSRVSSSGEWRRWLGWRGSSMPPSWSMTWQSVNASLATTGNGRVSKYVWQKHVLMEDISNGHDVLQATTIYVRLGDSTMPQSLQPGMAGF